MVIQQDYASHSLQGRRYLRPKNVTEIAGVSHSKVMAAIWGGELPAVQRGRAWLLLPEDVEAWIEGGARRNPKTSVQEVGGADALRFRIDRVKLIAQKYQQIETLLDEIKMLEDTD